MQKATILISSAGRRVELIRCFRADAESLGVELVIVAVDIDPIWSAACHEADIAVTVPRCLDPAFVAELAEICSTHSVDLIVPTIDTELPVLSNAQATFREIGTRIAVSSPDVIRLSRDKAATANFLTSIDVDVPRTEAASDVLSGQIAWSGPLILKPRGGSSSVGIQRGASLGDLRVDGLDTSTYIIQQLVHGAEYTVNVFFDDAGRLRAAVPHLRVETRGGEVSKGITVRHAALEDVATRLGRAMTSARGALCFQAIVDDRGIPYVFEINARFGGGFPLAHRAGARFTQWLLEETLNLPRTCSNTWDHNIAMIRYDLGVFETRASE